MGHSAAVKSPEPSVPPDKRADEVEADLAAALPANQGAGFFPMIRRLAWHLAAVLVLGAAAFVLWRAFRDIRPAEVLAAIEAWGWPVVSGALALSALSFALMGVTEWLALRWLGANLRLRTAFSGAFVASGISHSLGATVLVAGAVRARIYARHGVGLRQVAAVTVFQAVTFTGGLLTLAGISLLAAGGRDIGAVSRIAVPVADSLGVLLLAGVAGYVALCALVRRPLRALGHSLTLPSAPLALAQLSIGAVDNAVAAAIFWILLPAGSVEYFAFVAAYAPSVFAGLISHVPGGVGVFEGSLTTLLNGVAPAPMAAAFLGYRLFFFVLPLLVASLTLGLGALQQGPEQRA